jgi:hypothetical protein
VDTTKTGGISHKRIKIKKAIPVLKYQVMRMYGGVEVKFHTFLALVLYGVQWSSSHSSCFHTTTAPLTERKCSRASLDMTEK